MHGYRALDTALMKMDDQSAGTGYPVRGFEAENSTSRDGVCDNARN
jgi:hypothetical protein